VESSGHSSQQEQPAALAKLYLDYCNFIAATSLALSGNPKPCAVDYTNVHRHWFQWDSG